MIILKRISSKEVKRAFVLSDSVRFHAGNVQHMPLVSRIEFVKLLNLYKKKVLGMSQIKLDSLILNKPKQTKKFKILRQLRLNCYNNYSWNIVRISTDDLGVWKNAGGLPYSWTKNSLTDTAKKVKKYLEKPNLLKRPRLKYAVRGILKMSDSIKNEKYLYPIVFSSGTGTKGRRWCNKTKGDIDDGNMRAISLAVSGEKFIAVYFGIPK